MGKAEGWFSELEDDRLEVFLKTDGHKLRASGPPPFVYALVECWEEQTGTIVEGAGTSWRRSRRGPRPIAGQLDLIELSSEDAQQQ